MIKKVNLSKKQIIKMVVIIITSFILSFLGGYLITSIVNQENSYYTASFTYDGTKDLNNIVNKEYLESIKDTDTKKYGSVDVDKLIDRHHFSITKEDNNYVITTKTKYYDNFFFVSKAKMGTRAKTFIKLSLSNYVEDMNLVTFEDSNNIVALNNYYNPYIGGSIALSFGVLISALLIAYFIKNEQEDIEDNETLFHTPFHKEYWKGTLDGFKSTKKLVALAMLFALLLVSKLFKLPSGFGNLGIGLGYLFLAVIGLVYGPLVSIIIGFLSDTIGFFITSQSLYYFGYTIQAMLASLTYGLCFYKTRITFSKVLLTRIIVNLLLNVLLGSYLQCRLFMMSGTIDSTTFFETFKAYALLYSLPKNLVYLLPQSFVLYLVFKLVIPILSRFNLVDEKLRKSLTII